MTIVFDMVVGLALALMMHRSFRGRGFLRASILVPWAMPTVVSAMLWKTMFDPSAGFVDYLLGAFHPALVGRRLAGRERLAVVGGHLHR